MKRSGVRLSVCRIIHPAGLLLSAVPASDIDRQRREPSSSTAQHGTQQQIALMRAVSR